jgi:hypothetical protein
MIILATDRSFKVNFIVCYLLKIAVNNTHLCEFYQRAPMYMAQLVEIKGDINLESVQIYPGSGSMGGDMGFVPSPPQPSFGGDFNAGFGFPSAPPPPPLAVCIL